MHWDGFLEWLFEFEYKKLGLPAPDAVVYLAVDPDVSQRLIAQRYHGDESKKIFRNAIPNTWPVPAPPLNTAHASWAGTALSVPQR